MLRHVLTRGLDPNSQDRDGRTALYWVFDIRNFRDDDPGDLRDYVKLLLDYGADPDIRTKNGESVVDMANNSGYGGMREFIMAHRRHPRRQPAGV